MDERLRRKSVFKDGWLEDDIVRRQANTQQAENEGRPGRQNRLKEIILRGTELFLEPPKTLKVPQKIRRIVGNRLPEAALSMLWRLPTPCLWRDDDDHNQDGNSPMSLWKEKRYREQVEDYIRVLADTP